MPTAQTNVVQGQFTATGNAVNIDLGFLPTKFELINFTQQNSVANPGVVKKAEWNNYMADGSAYLVKNTDGAATDQSSVVTTGGFTLYDGRNGPQYGPIITGTTITKANPAVVTAAGHGLATGDVVRFSNNVVMKQLGGNSFVVTVTGANTFTIPLNTNTANFTAETGFSIRKLITPGMFYPGRRLITNITQANGAVISTATNHGLTVGQQVRIRVGAPWGMTQINNQQGVITAVTATTFTIGSINSSAYTAFAWPAATAVPFTEAFVDPVGSGPTPTTVGGLTYYQDLIDDATDNQSFQGISLGTAVAGAASDVIQWQAFRSDVNT
jgi:hypothetical protein